MRGQPHAFVRDLTTSTTRAVVLDGALVLGYLAILLAQAPLFGSLVLGLGLLQAALLLGTKRQMHTLTQRNLVAQTESQSYLIEALTGIATLKASGAETQTFDHWSALFCNHLNLSLRQNHLAAIIDTAARGDVPVAFVRHAARANWSSPIRWANVWRRCVTN